MWSSIVSKGTELEANSEVNSGKYTWTYYLMDLAWICFLTLAGMNSVVDWNHGKNS